ncbi:MULTISPECIES: SfnB family sulfur acquisition oxidoreductase [Paraburkholderia]|uniref:SfnB family sulfur acquisition oxidoreductase n=1 Tax=Paraburkholderia unamae TaxID=219649 RepID=A0ACC6RF54_9BURK
MTTETITWHGIAAHATEVTVIADDTAALEAARRFADSIAGSAADRDRERALPHEEIEAFVRTGLWGITVPRSHGGAAVSHVTLAEVLAVVSEADPAIGQIPQNHYCLVDAVRLIGNDAQQALFFREALAGRRFGNAVSETGTANSKTMHTRLVRSGGAWRLNGRKAYSTGALFAHWVPVAAVDDEGHQWLAYVPRNSPGLQVIDDWDGFGQRTTASGTVLLDDVHVDALHVLPRDRLFSPPTIHGPFAQLLHAAIDLGIARAALSDLRFWLRNKARPWADSGAVHASEDPLTLNKVGALIVRLHAAEGLLTRAGQALDAARAAPASEAAAVTAASIAVAEAKIMTTELALDASTTLIEFGGSQSTLRSYALDRHWRNARTHTVHDPVRWKYNVVGAHWLNGTEPARHASV